MAANAQLAGGAWPPARSWPVAQAANAKLARRDRVRERGEAVGRIGLSALGPGATMLPSDD